ncbi:GMC oxidoreductase [Biscogniauxia marginata]|nr:GMC oxidoreductase [Biscogniauxia marginata]
MGLYTKLPETIDEVDVIIAGGGTTACVVAARLADADPELSILLIEGGPNNEMPTVEYPAIFLAHLAPDSKTSIFYMAKTSSEVADRALVLPAGAGLNDLTGTHGTHISPEGKRQDAASCYLHPRLSNGGHPNLHVLVETQVTRILDENKRAVGVEVSPNPLFHPGDVSLPVRSVKARRLVVASCGTCGTPSLLERSGIGGREILDRAGVPVVVEISGVGNGYEDHHLLSYPYLNTLSPADTLDALALGRMGSFEDLMKNNHEMLGWNGQEIQAKVRPTDAEVAALGPDFQKAWDKEFKNHPDKPLGVINVIAGFPRDLRLATGDPCLAVSTFTVYPFSRGSIHITGPKLGDPVDFETGFFADPGQLDVKKHMWLYKKQRELIRRMPSYRGEMAQFHPPFAAGSGAANVELGNDNPLAADVPDIEYSAEDDAVLEKWMRENVSTTWHSLGTCKMLPRDVYGVQGLKIADLSIAPRNVAANTNNTALAVGEKAVDIFIKELALRSV